MPAFLITVDSAYINTMLHFVMITNGVATPDILAGP